MIPILMPIIARFNFPIKYLPAFTLTIRSLAHTTSNESNRENIEEILKEYEYIKYISGHVPSRLTSNQISDLLSMNDPNDRKKYLRYLFITEIRKLKDQRRKEQKKTQLLSYIENRESRSFGVFDHNGQLSYNLWANSLMTRISSQHVSNLITKMRLRFAWNFGQKLVIDMDYDDHMKLSECRIQARHIVNLLLDNIHTTDDPFDIFFTNCDYEKPTMKTLLKYSDSNPFQMMSWQDRFVSKSYLDLFPKQRLVYLTPHSKQAIKKYDPDDIYIIGAFLDKSSLNKPISHIKASREGIRRYRLPLDEYVSWGSGSSKHLCINHVVAILNQMKKTDDWAEAFINNIPKRKLKKSNGDKLPELDYPKTRRQGNA